ncbi:acyl--CoA ligase [Novosphingobium sp. G106]|uniref:class I adenylate-forming enzyme family protein n=1 Tax=Novosphingobium sp. G106 TaxID=2849500 RepID=UPI001C2D6E6F|nr:class I adenylate-forming enzyme family protein [Novosphingobium sp. G106]MBV1690538.1 acyl--CoA ligase [Novosphingobium sp. G106]
MSKESDVWTDPKAATTFPQLIRAAAATYGEAPAVKLTGETLPDETLSFADLDRRSAEIARGLIARGVGKGTRVGFIYGNGPGFATMLAAIARTGAVAIPISTMIRANELVRVLRQSDVSGLILQRKFLNNDYVERLCEALPELRESGRELRIAKTPYLRWLASTGENLPASFGDLGELIAGGGSVGEDFLRELENEVHPTDQMIEIYTSGSMALPKGVKHNHGPGMFRAHYLRGIIGIERGKEYPCYLPMFWVGGLMMSLLPNWEAGALTACTERTMSNSRVAMGSTLADEDLAMLKNQKPPFWGLGMSETLGPYSYGDEVRAPGRPVCSPMDHFADGYEIRIADENDQPVGDGEIGEMQVRGYPLATGLHKVEQSVYYTPDGYYHTGDMCLIEGTRVHFIGRNGDMIKTAGSNVAPAEVEMEMQAVEGIHNAYVVGLPDSERGQLLVAAVVPRDENAKLDFAEIEAKLRKQLSAYKVPRAYVQITREEVPLLHSNKVSRRMVTELVAARLGRPAA